MHKNNILLSLIIAIAATTTLIACGPDTDDSGDDSNNNTPTDEICDDDIDNDEDGDTDCADSDCANDTTCDPPLDECLASCRQLTTCAELEELCSFADITAFGMACETQLCAGDQRDPIIQAAAMACPQAINLIKPQLQAQNLCLLEPTDEVCDDNIDNDQNGKTDCEDRSCALDLHCVDTSACDAPQALTTGSFTSTTGDANNFAGSCGAGGNGGTGAEDIRLLTVETDTTVCIDTFDTEYDTILYVRTSCTDNMAEVTCNDDTHNNNGQGIGPSRVEFEATAGTSYYVFFDTFSSFSIESQDYAARVRFAPCTETTCEGGLDEDEDGDIDCADTDCREFPGCIEFTCDDGLDEDGDGAIDCDDSDCEGTDACTELTCDDELDEDGDGDIDCADSDCTGTDICLAILLQLRCEEATPITAPGTYTGISSPESATKGSCNNGNGGESILAFTPESDGLFCIDTEGSEFDTVLYLRTSCEDITPEAELICNDDGTGITPQSRVQLEATMGTTYTIVVDAFGNATDKNYTLNITEGPCPQ